MATIKLKRGTRAALDALAASNLIEEGEPYLILNEKRIAVGITSSTYASYLLEEEKGVTNSEVSRISNTFTVDLASPTNHKIITVSVATPFTLTFSNWKPAPSTNMVMVEMVGGGTASGITFPAATKFILPDGTMSNNFNDLQATLNTTESDFFMFWSRDSGSTIFARLMR